MNYTNGEGAPVSLNNLIAELASGANLDFTVPGMERRIWSALERLTPPERFLINAVYFQEDVRRSDQEIAGSLGIDGPELSRKRRAVLNRLIKVL